MKRFNCFIVDIYMFSAVSSYELRIIECLLLQYFSAATYACNNSWLDSS
jgi:hypothetical protein